MKYGLRHRTHRHHTPARTGQLEAAGTFSRQPARGLLSCANNLIFGASIAWPGEQVANVYQREWWPRARIQTDEYPVDAERYGRDRPSGMCAPARIQHSAESPFIEGRADH